MNDNKHELKTKTIRRWIMKKILVLSLAIMAFMLSPLAAQENQVSCTHRVECAHRVSCAHLAPCSHPVACVHRIQCVHRGPCQHLYMTPYGPAAQHIADLMHPFDTIHPADAMHSFGHPQHSWGDLEHAFDTQHAYDLKNEYERRYSAITPNDPQKKLDEMLRQPVQPLQAGSLQQSALQTHNTYQILQSQIDKLEESARTTEEMAARSTSPVNQVLLKDSASKARQQAQALRQQQAKLLLQ